MITSNHFKGKSTLSRSGVVGVVEVPSNLHNSIKMDMVVDKDRAVVTMCSGDNVYIATDEWGVSGETSMNLFFIDGGMLVEVVCGTLYMRGDNGSIFGVNELGDIEYPSNKTVKNIVWVCKDVVRDNAAIMTSVRYALPNRESTERYIPNLAYGVTAENMVKTGEPNCFRFKVDHFYKDLGLDKFMFISLKDPALHSENGEEDMFSAVEEIEEIEEIEDEGIIIEPYEQLAGC